MIMILIKKSLRMAEMPLEISISQKVSSMIVCVCNNISDREIRQAVDLGITSIDELRDALGVATNCGDCLTYAMEVLDVHLGATAIQETVLKRPSLVE